jgi:hypothetical protein
MRVILAENPFQSDQPWEKGPAAFFQDPYGERQYNRRYERGRQFSHGPPDEVRAASLRAKGIID